MLDFGTASHVSTAVWLQSGHFRLVFGAARKAGILPPEGEPGPRVTHIGFGLVLGEDGKRFRTRSSEVPSPHTVAGMLALMVISLLWLQWLSAIPAHDHILTTTHKCFCYDTRSLSQSSNQHPCRGNRVSGVFNAHKLLIASSVQCSWCGSWTCWMKPLRGARRPSRRAARSVTSPSATR